MGDINVHSSSDRDERTAIVRGDMENIWSRGYIDWQSFAGKTVLVTGAYGMLASYLVYLLMYLNIEKDIPVRVIAQGRQEAKAKEKFGAFWDHPDFTFTDRGILERWEPDGPVHYIIHAASLASPQYYETKPVEVIEPNAIGTWRMLQLARQSGTQGFLYFSTGDIYGKVADAGEITEDTAGSMDTLDAHSCYGESKRMGETLCAAFFREYGVRTVMARIGHTYSPTMDVVHDPRTFASFMKCALEGGDIVLHSDGLARRPFCYIADAAAAFVLLLLKGAGGEAYNVTNTEQFLSIRELAQLIANIPEKPLHVSFKERAADESYLDNPYNKANCPVENKLKELGWTAAYSAEDGFDQVYRYLKNQNNR